jgi:hypothetical protein
MAERGTFTSLHSTVRKYVARIEREPLPAKLRELVERLHEAEPIRDPREREGAQGHAQGKNSRARRHGPARRGGGSTEVAQSH